jgi:hypothetical protein
MFTVYLSAASSLEIAEGLPVMSPEGWDNVVWRQRGLSRDVQRERHHHAVRIARKMKRRLWIRMRLMQLYALWKRLGLGRHAPRH